jgi:uncharacterized membrane protein
MTRKLATYAAVGAFSALLVLFTGQIAVDSILRYFTDRQAAPEPILANAFANPFLAIHAAAGVAAIVVAPLQFVARIRERLPALHRATGRLYVAACAVGAPTGLMLAMGTVVGPMTGLAFGVLGVLWAVFTIFGVKSAMAGRFDDHRAWMIRSYAMASAAITLRLMLPVSGMIGLPFLQSYQAIAWLCWIANLAAAELYLRRKPRTVPLAAEVATA